MSHPLIVYKASAGSGKTFTLATEYIKLLVENPQSYRQTLAVTFTNKATEEMKTRIMSQLYGIWKGLPSSQGYARKVEADLGLTPQHVSQQAGLALMGLLHNYSYFRVETIDSFFQSVLRNLARELDLTPNLRIGLNDVQVEELAVDQIIDDLSATDPVLQWLMKYIMENIGDDRSWNVIGQIKQFGRTIFRDFYKLHAEELRQVSADAQFFDRYAAMLRDVRREADERMATIADAFMSELDAEGLSVDDLSYGRSGVAGMFLKMKRGEYDADIVGKRVTDCLDAPGKWCKKSHPRRDAIEQMAATSLGDILRYAIDERPRQYLLSQSATLTLRHLNQLRLLSTIEQKVRQLNNDANRFLLSDTQHLLQQLIEGSDSPFIFEKIGAQLEHIMIDEFQDTSTVQWQNFKVLLAETMSRGNSHNLIVGDVKQSIYRWRSGDWRLLAGIKHEFSNAAEMVSEQTLGTNYRSARRIVGFNNAFFTIAAQMEQATAYDDVAQQVPASRADDGSVSMVLLPASDYQEQTLSRLTADIAQLIADGVSPTTIAILVRTNSHIPLIADYLMEQLPDVRVVSDEAFRLDASPAVVCIIQALGCLLHPDDLIARASLAKTYSGRLDGPLPEGFTPDLLTMPLYDLAEHLYGLFRLNRMPGQASYLCSFYDQIAAYASEQTTDVSAFLREWDESIGAKTIQSPEIDGIRIISIHKSKGLEFPHVFVPFCDWRLEHRDVLWCQPAEAPFSQLPLAAIDYSQAAMQGTIYEPCYEEEHQQNTIDNLNLLYVAFTRAATSLHVYGKRGARQSRSCLLEQIIPQLPDALQGQATVEGEADASEPLTFTYGTPPHPAESTDGGTTTAESNPFLITPRPRKIAIDTFPGKVQFRQSNKSREFAKPVDDAPEADGPNYVQTGNVLHGIFSTIRTTADIDTALTQLEQEGIIYDRHITPERIATMIRRRLSDPRVAEWFSDRWQLFNECTILAVDPATGQLRERRPDRVMTDGQQTIVVDFKFGRERQEYTAQVQEYMQLLQAMHMPAVKGYLWYVYSNQIVEVTAS